MEPSKNKAFAVLVAVFLAGVVSGAVGVRVYNQQIAQAGSSSPRIDLHAQPGVVAKHLRDELALTEDQVAQVEDILDECIMREADLLMQTKQLRAEARQHILELLNDGQRKKFNTVIDEVSSQ
jgi:hypothetical protein